jgi:iron complex outermembrane receptor protein
VTGPKVYIDGVAVANSLLLTRLDPQSIARVEVIRGPQGAALFGADAISGVINVVSRGGADSLSRGLQIRNETGLSTSAYASAPVLSQRTELSARMGSNLRSSGLGLTFNSFGEYVPGAASREFTASGDSRIVGAPGVVTGAARFLDMQAGWGPNPGLVAFDSQRVLIADRFVDALGILTPGSRGTVRPESFTLPQKLRQYSANLTAVDGRQNQWTPSLTVGIDGYRLSNVAFAPLPTRNASDSAFRRSEWWCRPATIRLSAGQFGSAEATATTVTLSGEHTVLRDETSALSQAMVVSDSSPSNAQNSDPAWYRNTGLVLQTSGANRNSLFFSSGIRLERLSGPEASAEFTSTHSVSLSGEDRQRERQAAVGIWRRRFGQREFARCASLVGTRQTVTAPDFLGRQSRRGNGCRHRCSTTYHSESRASIKGPAGSYSLCRCSGGTTDSTPNAAYLL